VPKIKLVTFVSSPEGIRAFEIEHPDVDIITGSIDEGLGAVHIYVYIYIHMYIYICIYV